jgi:hypothetical protein
MRTDVSRSLTNSPQFAGISAGSNAGRDRARDPAFFVCLGPGQFLGGDAARKAHHVWSDIPPALVEAWRKKEEPRAEVTAQGSNQSG